MRQLRTARLAPRQLVLGAVSLAMLAGCSQRPQATPADADPALNNDLALAGQRQAATQVVSPQELTGASARAPEPTRGSERTRVIEHVIYRTAPAAPAPAPYATVAPAPAPVARPTYDPYPPPREAGTYNGGGYGNGGYGSGGAGRGGYGTGGYGGTYGATPRPVYRQPQGHAQRDGAIGAVAGAMVGVAASHRKDRLRGGLIGAVAGGALGALYGHSVDRTP
ncbi:MAG TPA: glycine zipper domain-containing protein [Gemmatirosa sp.]